MIDIGYQKLPVSKILDKNDFFRLSGLKESGTLRNLCTTCKRLFMISDNGIILSLIGDSGIYQIKLLDKKKILIGNLYYIPKERRLDVYDGVSDIPLISWKSRKCVWKNYSYLLQIIKIENLFLPLISFI